jgi:hypothetical protein
MTSDTSPTVLLQEANWPANAVTAHRGHYECRKEKPEYRQYRQRVDCDAFPIPFQQACLLERPHIFVHQATPKRCKKMTNMASKRKSQDRLQFISEVDLWRKPLPNEQENTKTPT